MAAGVAGAMAATLEPILEVVGPDGSRYLVMREHASKFATVHGVIRPDNFTRAMKPEKLQFYGKIIEGWQAAEHVRFVEQQDKVTGDVVDFRFIGATAKHDMEEFYNRELLGSPVPSFDTFRHVLSGKRTMPGYRVTTPDLRLTRDRCKLVSLEGQPGLPPAQVRSRRRLPAHPSSHPLCLPI